MYIYIYISLYRALFIAQAYIKLVRLYGRKESEVMTIREWKGRKRERDGRYDREDKIMEGKEVREGWKIR